MYRALGHIVCRYPWLAIMAWVFVAVALQQIVPNSATLTRSEPASLLPDDSALNESMEAHYRAFPEQASRSQVVLVYQRKGGLLPSDRAHIASTAIQLQSTADDEGAEPWRIKSSQLQPAYRPRLESADGSVVMTVIDLDVNFVTGRAANAAATIEAHARAALPEGLVLEITGTAAIGREHNIRSEAALERTTRVTILAVLIILAVVYRSPLGALVPLLSIGLSVYIAFRVLDLLSLVGWSVSNAERTFTVVLLFGAGTDYALFWISRYREELSRRRSRFVSAVSAMSTVGPAVLASAGTTIFGLMMLIFADMIVIKNSGKVLWIVLSISLLAALTLTPALAYLMGHAFFWPGSAQRRMSLGQRIIWPRVARDVVRRPSVILLIGLIVIGIPAIHGMRIPFRYDSFGEVARGSSAERGLIIAEEHFSKEALLSSRLLIESVKLNDLDQARALSDRVAAAMLEFDGVIDVWAINQPFGVHGGWSAATAQLPIVADQVAAHYHSIDQRMVQFEVMLAHEPYSIEAATLWEQLEARARQITRDHCGETPAIYGIGPTPYIVSVKAVADRDMKIVIVLVIAVIWLIVLVLLRRPWLSVFMLVATLVTYSASLGLAHWVFVGILDRPALDYKIKILVFVIIVAVGQDYNIFLVTRMFQELRSYSMSEAITRSIVLTGPVISSCGLIMAATLGSLVSTGVDLTQQLGFAFAAGILIDTFMVRPLLIPSFYLLSQRWTRKSRAAVGSIESPQDSPA